MYLPRIVWLPFILMNIINTEAIFCGKRASIRNFKYMASILQSNSLHCGGAIISEQHVLTAAHCVFCGKEDNFAVVVGVAHLADSRRLYKFVEKIYVHPDYSGKKSQSKAEYCARWLLRPIMEPPELAKFSSNDIAILKITGLFNMGVTVEKVALPQTGDLPYCEPCSLAGWGRDERSRSGSYNLKRALMKIETPQQCKTLRMPHRTNEFCAVSFESRACPLKGDSGGPLVYQGVVLGVISRGGLGKPTVFTKVYDFKDWIQKILDDEK